MEALGEMVSGVLQSFSVGDSGAGDGSVLEYCCERFGKSRMLLLAFDRGDSGAFCSLTVDNPFETPTGFVTFPVMTPCVMGAFAFVRVLLLRLPLGRPLCLLLFSLSSTSDIERPKLAGFFITTLRFVFAGKPLTLFSNLIACGRSLISSSMLTGGVIIPPRWSGPFFRRSLLFVGVSGMTTLISPCEDFTRSPSLMVYSSIISGLTSSQFLKSARRATSSH